MRRAFRSSVCSLRSDHFPFRSPKLYHTPQKKSSKSVHIGNSFSHTSDMKKLIRFAIIFSLALVCLPLTACEESPSQKEEQQTHRTENEDFLFPRESEPNRNEDGNKVPHCPHGRKKPHPGPHGGKRSDHGHETRGENNGGNRPQTAGEEETPLPPFPVPLPEPRKLPHNFFPAPPRERMPIRPTRPGFDGTL